MRTSTIARAGVVVTASALALSLSTGPASAAETSSVDSAIAPATSAQAFRAGSVDAAGVPTSGIRFSSSVITEAPQTRFFGTGTFSSEDATAVAVSINGRAKGTVPLLYSAVPGDNAIAVDIPRGWGSGKVRLNVAGTPSNSFYARKNIKAGRSNGKIFTIRHRGNSVKLSAVSIKIINPSSGAYVGLRKIKVQQHKKGKWRTLKTITMNTKGSGSVTYKTRKKYRYRLKSSATPTQILFQSENSSKI